MPLQPPPTAQFSTEAGNADFSAGAEVSAVLRCSDLGSLSYVIVKPTGGSAQLQLAVVEVHNLSTGGDVQYFPHNGAVDDGAEPYISAKVGFADAGGYK